MTAVVAILGSDQAAVAGEVARRLSGRSVVIPYDTVLAEWPVKPGDTSALDLVTAKQMKLVTAGYVREGFHVVLHGSFGEAASRRDEGLMALLRLMGTIPGVHTLLVRGTPSDVGSETPQADLVLNSGWSAGESASAIVEALPLEALNAG